MKAHLRQRKIQWTRRSVQVAIVLLLLAIPLLSLYESHLAKRGGMELIESSFLLSAIHATVQATGLPKSVWSSVKGSLWTLSIAGYRISDPLAVVEFMATSRQVMNSFLLSALLLVVVTLLLGRVFCSWICPMNLLMELTHKIRNKLTNWGFVLMDVPFARRDKYLLLAAGLVVAFFLRVQIFPWIYPPKLISDELFGLVFYGSLGLGTAFVIAVAIIEVFVSERWWCRYICPGGALYSLVGAPRVLRLKRIQEKCISCPLCDRACGYGLSPSHDEMGIECDNCARCLTFCPHEALTYRRLTSVGEVEDVGQPVSPDEG